MILCLGSLPFWFVDFTQRQQPSLLGGFALVLGGSAFTVEQCSVPSLPISISSRCHRDSTNKSDALKPTWRSKQLEAQQRNKPRCGRLLQLSSKKAGPLSPEPLVARAQHQCRQKFRKVQFSLCGDDVLKQLTHTEAMKTAAKTKQKTLIL